MDEAQANHDPSRSSSRTPPEPKTWIAPAIFILAVAVPILILIFSNTDSTSFNFAWFHVLAPRWMILAITFVAGALVTRLFGWAWRSMRRRQQA